MAFPTDLTNAIDNLTEIIAAHLNALEAKVGIDGSAVATSLDYMVRHPVGPLAGINGLDGEDAWPILGPPGVSIQGPVGITIPGRDGEDGEDAWPIPGKDGSPGTGGGGVDVLACQVFS